ncbi:MAG: arsenate reductase (glutaredoxin) [Betaproteobacteria bacterium]|nr:arsenate reductase (glutaredoxin) [Betaproteobacteria bacterium]
MTITIYHNPLCSKSRETLALLEAHGLTPKVVAYLEQPPSTEEIRDLLALLGMDDARALMRKGEAEYKELGLDSPSLGQDALINAMASHPRLIERPIVINGRQAALGRPPEKVLTIL